MNKYQPVLVVGCVFKQSSVPHAGRSPYPGGIDYRLTWTVVDIPIAGPIWYFPPREGGKDHRIKCYGCGWIYKLKLKRYLLDRAMKHLCSARIDQPVWVAE